MLQFKPGCYHSAAGMLALSSVICSLPCLTALQLQLPVRLQPTALQAGALQQLNQQLVQTLQGCRIDSMEFLLADRGHGHVWAASGPSQSWD